MYVPDDPNHLVSKASITYRIIRRLILPIDIMFPEYIKRKPLDDDSVARDLRLGRGSCIGYPRQRLPSYGDRVSSARGILPLSSDEQFMARFQYSFDPSVYRCVSTFP